MSATNLCSFSDQVVPDTLWLSKNYARRLVDFARLKSNEGGYSDARKWMRLCGHVQRSTRRHRTTI